MRNSSVNSPGAQLVPRERVSIELDVERLPPSDTLDATLASSIRYSKEGEREMHHQHHQPLLNTDINVDHNANLEMINFRSSA